MSFSTVLGVCIMAVFPTTLAISTFFVKKFSRALLISATITMLVAALIVLGGCSDEFESRARRAECEKGATPDDRPCYLYAEYAVMDEDHFSPTIRERDERERVADLERCAILAARTTETRIPGNGWFGRPGKAPRASQSWKDHCASLGIEVRY